MCGVSDSALKWPSGVFVVGICSTETNAKISDYLFIDELAMI